MCVSMPPPLSPPITAESGSPWQTVINSMRLSVSSVISSPQGQPVAYVDGTHFLGDKMELRDADSGAPIAYMDRTTLTLSAWRWNVTIVQPGHPIAAGVKLALIAGYRSWALNPRSSDLCNVYFTFSVYAAIIAVGVACLAAWYHFRRRGTSARAPFG